jgi:hypothetical protein
MQNNILKYIEFVMNVEWNDYLRNMRRNTVFGTYLEVFVIRELLLPLHLIILSETENIYNHFAENGDLNQDNVIVFLHTHGNHFEATRKRPVPPPHPPPPLPLPLPQLSSSKSSFSRTNPIPRRKKDLEASSNILEKPFSSESLPLALKEILPPPLYFGSMSEKCKYCGVLFWRNEGIVRNKIYELSRCCAGGKCIPHKFDNFPVDLRELFEGKHEHSVEFKDHIRQYNSALAFGSLNCHVDHMGGGGPYAYRIHGQIYRNVGPLDSEKEDVKIYSHYYIFDPEIAAGKRMENKANEDCNYELMFDLSLLISTINPIAESFRMLNDIYQESINEWFDNEDVPLPNLCLRFDSNSNLDENRYNMPTSNDIAAVFVSEDGNVPTDTKLTIFPYGNELQEISFLDKRVDSFLYPLLFPLGETGWDMRNKKIVSIMDYYSSMLHFRQDSWSPLFLAGKLFQQFIVDAYVKFEQNSLSYLRFHQQDLHADSYMGIREHLQNFSTESNRPLGRIVILPSGYKSGPRGMFQTYQDSMALVNHFGKPTYFITFTCNPNWREIKENLILPQTASDRPDIVARVFKQKLDELYDDLWDNNIFGTPLCIIYQVEFQKRGLPHAHILLTVDSASAPKSPEMLDLAVCAEFPNPFQQAPLYDLVAAHMIHHPCGIFNQTASCMQDGKCSKLFPKEFQNFSLFKDDAYPTYRRRNDGVGITIKNVFVNNSWVVPYNKYLLMKYQAHINVEVCTSIKSVKYLYKYVYKGYDSAYMSLKREMEISSGPLDYDEINAHIDARYVSAPEACWRLFSFSLDKRSHSVMRLALHLENEQSVYFEEGEEEEALEKADKKPTSLMAFFNICNDYSLNKKICAAGEIDPRTLTYPEMPFHFRFDISKHEWLQRKMNKFQIGRMRLVSPTQIELFYLRLLLLSVPGPTSFQNLRTYEGKVLDSFQATALARGFISNDEEWSMCMEEASLIQMPHRLRTLFASIIALNAPSNGKELWNDFKEVMSDDFVYQGDSHEVAEQKTLQIIAEILAENGKTLEETIGMKIEKSVLISLSDPIDKEVLQKKVEDMIESLNENQYDAFNAILNAIENEFDDDISTCFFIDGPGGSGKTYLYECLNNYFLFKNIQVLNVAWSGIAATLLMNGATVHHQFKLPFQMADDSASSSITAQSKEGEEIREADVVIWDEAPMASKFALNAVDRLCQFLSKNNQPFGGKIMILGGDFRQVLPIVSSKLQNDQINASIKKSHLWKHFKILHLTTNMRASDSDPEFPKWLLRIGDGKEKVDENGEITLLPEMICQKDIVTEIFSGINISNSDEISNTVILCSTNSDADLINAAILTLLPGEDEVFLSNDEHFSQDKSPYADSNTLYSTEIINNQTPHGMPPHKLLLKKGAVVMLLRNLSVKFGLCNGTRLRVIGWTESHRLIQCSVLTGARKNDIVLLPRIKLQTLDTDPIQLIRRQFPIKLSFAMTIHKSQGQTFQRVGVCLTSPLFTHGQLYVALSRCRSKDNLKVQLSYHKSKERKTKNIVYKEIFD